MRYLFLFLTLAPLFLRAQQENALEEDLKALQDEVARSLKAADQVLEEQKVKLERIAGMTADKAKQQLMENMVGDARMAAARSIKQIREETERAARREGIKILSLAVQRYASEHVAEGTVSVVDLPNDEMKGRIIGREGRTIKSFESMTGTTLLIDETPDSVLVSSFDPVRRETARRPASTAVSPPMDM